MPRQADDDPSAMVGALEDLAARVLVGDETTRYEIDGKRPNAIVQPVDLDELSEPLKVAHENGLAVAPWGGGTRTALGNSPERVDVVLDLSSLNRIVAHNPGDLTATVQAGATITDLQKTIGEHGQFLALDPPLPHQATIGGTLAAGLSGPLKWRYGSPRDVVIGMRIVQPDGKVTKSGGQVVKNVSGYDMARLHVGGLGTLGVIAEVSIKLTPTPANQATVLASYDDARRCHTAALAIFHSPVTPLALTVFDRSANKRMNAVGIKGGCLLALRLGGRLRTLERQVRECRTMIDQHGSLETEVLQESEASGIWRSLADFGWDETTMPLIGLRVSLPPSRVYDLVHSVERMGGADDLQSATISHPAHGTVLVGWYSKGGDTTLDKAKDLIRAVVEAARQMDGRTIVEQCPIDVKSGMDVWGEMGEQIEIMRRLKEQYDPKRVLNPGRFAGRI